MIQFTCGHRPLSARKRVRGPAAFQLQKCRRSKRKRASRTCSYALLAQVGQIATWLCAHPPGAPQAISVSSGKISRVHIREDAVARLELAQIILIHMILLETIEEAVGTGEMHEGAFTRISHLRSHRDDEGPV